MPLCPSATQLTTREVPNMHSPLHLDRTFPLHSREYCTPRSVSADQTHTEPNHAREMRDDSNPPSGRLVKRSLLTADEERNAYAFPEQRDTNSPKISAESSSSFTHACWTALYLSKKLRVTPALIVSVHIFRQRLYFIRRGLDCWARK